MLAGYDTKNTSTKSTKHTMSILKQMGASEQGFTLIELLITVAVMGVVAAFAVPNVSRQVAEGRMKSTAKLLESTLKEAKAESLIRRKDVAMEYKVAVTDTPAMLMLYTTKSDGTKNELIQYTLNEKSMVTYTVDSSKVGNSEGAVPIPPSNTIVFKPSKRISSNPIIYTICDGVLEGETGITVTVDKLSNISLTRDGICS